MSTTSLPRRLTTPRTLFIGARWQGAAERYERFDPAQLERSTGSFALATPEHVAAAYGAAAAAQPDWGATPAPQRAEVLRLAAAHLATCAEEAAQRLTADMGKVIRDARAEVQRSVTILRYFAGELTQPIGIRLRQAVCEHNAQGSA